MQFNSQTLWFEGQTEVPRHVTIHRFVHPSTVFVPDVTDPKTSDNCGTKSILRIRNHKLRGNRNQPSLDSWLLHIPTLPCVCVCVCVATVVRGKYTFLCLCLCVCTQNHHHQHQCCCCCCRHRRHVYWQSYPFTHTQTHLLKGFLLLVSIIIIILDRGSAATDCG